MRKKLFVDTNILLDAAMDERPGWAAATLLMDEFAYGEAVGYVAASSLKDVYYVLTKYADESASRKYIEAIMQLFELVPVDKTLCHLAIRSDEPDFEDAIIRACAESIPVDFIISRDVSAFKRSSIKSLSAQEYLDLFTNLEATAL